MITGIRGLCNGLGPALYGFIFYIFHVELDEVPGAGHENQHPAHDMQPVRRPLVVRMPYLTCSFSVLMAFQDVGD